MPNTGLTITLPDGATLSINLNVRRRENVVALTFCGNVGKSTFVVDSTIPLSQAKRVGTEFCLAADGPDRMPDEDEERAEAMRPAMLKIEQLYCPPK